MGVLNTGVDHILDVIPFYYRVDKQHVDKVWWLAILPAWVRTGNGHGKFQNGRAACPHRPMSDDALVTTLIHETA